MVYQTFFPFMQLEKKLLVLESEYFIHSHWEEKLAVLEGEYFLFKFGANWFDQIESIGLTLLQLKDNKFVEIYHPCDHNDSSVSEEEDKECLEYMLNHNIKKVYTFRGPTNPSTVFGKIFVYLSKNDSNLNEIETKEYREHLGITGKDKNAYAYHSLDESISMKHPNIKDLKSFGIKVVIIK